jgi:hypothetical protein
MNKDFFKKNIAWVIVAILLVVIAYLFFGKSYRSSDNEVVAPNVVSNNQSEALATNTGNQNGEAKEYSYTEAPNHIGEYAKVTGNVAEVFTSKTNTTFLDFCQSYKTCPFTAVIFSSAKSKFQDTENLVGSVTITGTIKSYQGKAEIVQTR